MIDRNATQRSGPNGPVRDPDNAEGAVSHDVDPIPLGRRNPVSENARPFLGRRMFLKAVAGGGAAAVLAWRSPWFGDDESTDLESARPISHGEKRIVDLAATSGWMAIPLHDPDNGVDGLTPIPPFFPDNLSPGFGLTPAEADYGRSLFAFGFRDVTGLPFDSPLSGSPANDPSAPGVMTVVGRMQTSAPLMFFNTGDDVTINVYNVGIIERPDLADGHTMHWHGFPNQIPYFDGVPETTLSVPIYRGLPYRFLPHEPGTYMYHCHFEDVEHVQMGMIGVVYIQPEANAKWILGLNPTMDHTANPTGWLYDHSATEFTREFCWMLTEIDVEEHWSGAHIQQPDWSEHRSNIGIINGRTYPDTLADQTDAGPGMIDPVDDLPGDRLRYQPNSALVRGNASETIALRVANLGYRNHSLEAPGLKFRVVGQDAKLLLGPTLMDGGRGTYLPGDVARDGVGFESHVIDVAPGRSYDVLVDLPAFAGGTGGSDANGLYDVYPIYDRNSMLPAASLPGYGGMRSEIRVYDGGLAAQAGPNL